MTSEQLPPPSADRFIDFSPAIFNPQNPEDAAQREAALRYNPDNPYFQRWLQSYRVDHPSDMDLAQSELFIDPFVHYFAIYWQEFDVRQRRK